MEVTRFQKNKGKQVTSLKAEAQTSPITSISLLWPKQLEKPIQMTEIKKLGYTMSMNLGTKFKSHLLSQC